jgi:spoIIIJ-associated protein
MKGFLGKLFGGKNDQSKENSPAGLLADVLETIITISNLELSFDVLVNEETGGIKIDLYGKDEGLLLNRDGQLLDGMQLFLKRVLQHQLPEDKISLILDCDSYRERSDESLLKLANKLKGIVIEKGKPVYVKALPPGKRKIVHQFLAEDDRVKSRSIGDGHFKKVKIFLTKDSGGSNEPQQAT